MTSWLRKGERTPQMIEALQKCFDKYCEETLSWISNNCRVQVPQYEVSLVSVLCSLLDALLNPNPDMVEYQFVFCIVFAFGGCLGDVDGIEYRKQFSNWWKNEMKAIKYSSKGSVFDFMVQDTRMVDWSALVERLSYTSQTQMSEVTVPTSETTSLSYFMKALIEVSHPVMLIGLAGCGKTQSCMGLLKKLDPTVFSFHKMNMSYYTDSTLLQAMMEAPLEKKAGKLYAPPGKLQMIYMVDDLNMPALDQYNTQSAIELMKQKQDYQHWYDRSKITVKDIGNTQYLCCMNPTAGSFVVNERFQRHFWTSCVQFPEQTALSQIYSTFMKGHFEGQKFKLQVQEMSSGVIKAALSLHPMICNAFRKTAKNMHYEFNIRHMSGVFSGLLKARSSEFVDAEKLALLWIHESERVYGDRLVCMSDLRKYRHLIGDLCRKMFSKVNCQKYFQDKDPEPLVFAPFSKGIAEMAEGEGGTYDKVKDMDRLFEILSEAMRDYDATYAAMDLVLFEDAMKHVCKISRIISSPSGHPLLVGVGGSGRQSLSRLSAFACQCQTFMIVISSTYNLNDLKANLQAMYKRAGEKNEGVVFLFTDNQLADERFLVYFNDLLSSGEITDLYSNEDSDMIRNAVRSAAKAAQVIDTPDNLWNYYISRVRKNLHMSLCFSPVGDAMWSRARKFPALVNCTVIDWFQPWPMDALQNVAAKFLAPMTQLGPADHPHRPMIVDFFPFSFEAVNQLSQNFIDNERRYSYTTPKSFLELIKLYRDLLEAKTNTLADRKIRLTNGLIKLKDTEDMVNQLKEDLKEKAVIVQEKALKSEEFADEVGREKAKVNAEAEKANIEAAKCQHIAEQVSEKKADCARDLADALPLVAQAETALNVLDKKEFNELKAFSRPPHGVDIVCEAAMHLQAGIDPSIDVDKRGRVRDRTWKGSIKMMMDPNKFLFNLKGFKQEIDAMRVPAQNVDEARRLKDSMGREFTPENMAKKAQAAGGLCEWIVNIIKYYDIVIDTEPKKKGLESAKQTLEAAEVRYAEVTNQVKELEAKLAALVAEFDQAIADKNAVVAEAEKCQVRLQMAQRLVGALGANGVIWEETVAKTAEDLVYAPGDLLVACSFACYVGVFTREYREKTIDRFVDFLLKKEIPMSPSCDPLTVLSTEAEQARWCAKGLPSDRVSLENGSIMTVSERWCLMIDPQTQGILWAKNKESGNGLQITRMGHDKMVKTFEVAIEEGTSVLIENMGESIEAVLQPVICRNTIKRGGVKVMKLGDKEIPYSPKFKLFLQTKLSNPHYPPEVQAECTIINFTVTEQGLEEQLLFLVVRLERPDLARKKAELIQQQNGFKVKLADLEALLLEKLTSSEGDVLEDVNLIISLEDAKVTFEEAKVGLKNAMVTEAKINETSEYYRPSADRGALLFFLMMDLAKMHSFYHYSLDAFVMVVTRSISSVTLRKPKEVNAVGAVEGGELIEGNEGVEGNIGADGGVSGPEEEDEAHEEEQDEEEQVIELQGKELTKRVELLLNTITLFVFCYVRRGLLDADKLTVASMLALRVLVRLGAVDNEELNLLIRAPADASAPPVPDSARSWLSDIQWQQLKSLETIAVFKTSSAGLCQHIEQDSLGWKRWFGEDKAEIADLPRSCRSLQTFHRLFLLRVLRPDRIGNALTNFVEDNLSSEYVEQPPFDMEALYEETTCLTPLFFVLFPGTDPTPVVENFARQLGCTETNMRLSNISMGQGQETTAIATLTRLAREGGWVMLQNIHLMQSWLKQLERALEMIDEFAHPDFRCVLTSEPPSLLQGPLWPLLPESILQKCIKICDEAPTDLKSNLRRAYSKFSQETIEACLKPREFKATLFALCLFHSLISGRIKFGAQGWSKKYPFNDGDLTICAQVLGNYLNSAEKLGTDVPWPDLRYIFSEIMYGGHITDHWDRRVCVTYLETLLIPELLNNLTLTPAVSMFKSPDATKMDYAHYQKFIEERLPPETPQLFGLHPNAEIGFLTNQGVQIFTTIQMVSGAGSGSGSVDITASTPIIAKYMEQLPSQLDIVDVRSKLKDEDYTPYIISSLQEGEMMNKLLGEVRGSMLELELGIGGALNVTERMEKLSEALQFNRVSDSWKKLAHPSLKLLAAWFLDLVARVGQLARWTSERKLLHSIWISGLFNSMAFLTAVMQVTARERMLPLDYMTNRAFFTNTQDHADLVGLPKTGVHVHGLFLEGASWEEGKGDDEGYISDPKMKELHVEMPVCNVYSVHIEQMDWTAMYHCPVFSTAERGGTFVVELNVRIDPDDDEKRWILAGAAMLLADD